MRGEAAGDLGGGGGGRCKPPKWDPGAKPREKFQKTGCLVLKIQQLERLIIYDKIIGGAIAPLAPLLRGP